ncbi:MAG: GNAT family N-acetyltransferase [Betaproteobacteria bacterium]|nr:GNAT family N-acetyltransferase [Betaproteobacteria bacterium]
MPNKHYQLNKNPVGAPPSSPPPETLRGKYIALEPLAAAVDAVFAELFAATHGDARRESVWDFLPYGQFANAQEMADFYRQTGAGGDPQFYAVRHLQKNNAAGIASYLRILPESHSIEIGHIWHAADFQRGRANTEAVFLLADNIFSRGYRRLEWKCNALNMHSRRAALRLGFAFEGVFRQCTVAKGKNRDTAWFAILDADWKTARENFCEWLDSPPGAVSLAKKNLPLVEWSLPAHDFWAAE